MKKVQFTETVLRDANQSLIATRLPYDKFEPILETIDQAGFYSAEVWGGATFDVCLRFLNEDPWERLRKIRAKMPNTKLQMLLRGQNILGYKHYSDDIVRRFVRASVRNGIDIIRIFDALNDVNNLKVAIEETVKSGAIASGAISYTTSPVHTLEKYVQIVKELKQMGFVTVSLALTDQAVPIDDPSIPADCRLAVILGNEGAGLCRQTVSESDHTAIIPMTNGVDSLNVAAASAVAFWQLGKRRP